MTQNTYYVLCIKFDFHIIIKNNIYRNHNIFCTNDIRLVFGLLETILALLTERQFAVSTASASISLRQSLKKIRQLCCNTIVLFLDSSS